MIDKFGQKLEIGDNVIFAKGDRQNTNLYEGIIVNIMHRENYNTFKIKCNSSGAINRRISSELLKIDFFRESYPEYFI